MSEELSNEEGQPQSTQSSSQAQSTLSPSQAQSTQSSSQAQSTQSSSQAQSTLSPSQAQSTQSQSLSQSKSQSQPGSSSSSGPTSSSQSSSGSGTLSSVDTIPVTLPSVPEEPEPQPWGRLLPMAQGFRAHNCVEDQYLFGRDSKCDYVLDDPNEPGSKRFRIYSKKHFRIYRENSQVFVEDYSNNGTFVEGQLVGQKRKFPLFNNAVLALSEQRNKVFVFIDLMSDDQSALPQELRDKYFVTQRIGTGVCGEVRMAFSRSTCQEFAVKIINKKNFRSEGTAVRNAQTEIEILKRINHPCLIKTEDFYQTDDSFYIVLELMKGGELFQRIKSQQQLQESVTKLYFYQMLRAVQYLHSNGIIHRDLKPENVLLSSQDDICLIKLTDFNQSRILEEAALMRTLCGTPLYLAPEVFTHATTTGYSLAVDAWSLGVLLFVCLGGYPPFHEDFGHQSIRDQIVRGEFTMVQSKWRNVSDQAKDVVRRLLVVDPCQRMTVEEALQHTWLQDDDMLNTAHRLMYPDADAAVAAAAVAVAAEAEPAGPSRRKRGRGDEDDDEDHPAKRRLTPPSTS